MRCGDIHQRISTLKGEIDSLVLSCPWSDDITYENNYNITMNHNNNKTTDHVTDHMTDTCYSYMLGIDGS